MPSMRSGFSQRLTGGGNALRLGTVIKLGIDGRADATMMVSAIVRRGADSSVLYVLLTAHSPLRDYASDARCSLIRGSGQSRLPLGTFVEPERVLGSSARALGFHVLRLDDTPLFGAMEGAELLSTTRNFRKGIWNAGTFKVRRLNPELPPPETNWPRQRRPYLDNRMGRVAGDIDDVEIQDVGRTLRYSYCGLVTRGRDRPLGDPASLGAPLVSRSGALSAIIVGAEENDTLVFPVEELKKEASLDFVTLGGDWPKVRVKPRMSDREQSRRTVASSPATDPMRHVPAPVSRAFLPGDLAVDIGTANTVVYVRGRGIVLNEPSLMAVEMLNGVRKVRAVGTDAAMLAEEAPGSIEIVHPFRDGVVADLEFAAEMIRQFVSKSRRGRVSGIGRPQVVMAVPSGSTSVERRAFRDAATGTRTGQVYLIEESIAAAIGAGVPVTEPGGRMIVDIGGGTTEIAVISLRGLAYATSVRVGGDRMDEAIVSYVRRTCGLLIGEATAERIKQEIGTVRPSSAGIGGTIVVKGRDLVTGMPKDITVNQRHIAEALREPITAIIEGIRTTLENVAPAMATDIADRGIVLTGGGALLRGLDELVRDEIGLSVVVANHPLTCAVSGAATAMDLHDAKILMLLS